MKSHSLLLHSSVIPNLFGIYLNDFYIKIAEIAKKSKVEKTQR
jgi:hypothetical protein